MHGWQVGVVPAEVATTTDVKCIGNRPSPVCVMSLNVGVSIGPFDSETFSSQEETINTQGR